MHLRQAEVTEEKNSSAPSRAIAPGSSVQPARRRPELRSLVRLIWISLPFEGVPASLVSPLENASAERRAFFQKQCNLVQFSAIPEEHRKSTRDQLAFALAQIVSAAEWACPEDVTKMKAYRLAKDTEMALRGPAGPMGPAPRIAIAERRNYLNSLSPALIDSHFLAGRQVRLFTRHT